MRLDFSKSLLTDGVSLEAVGRANSRSTVANTYVSTTTALTILLLSSQWTAGTMAVGLPHRPTFELRVTNRPSGQTIMPNEGISPHLLVSALIQFHDRIVSTQEDLPAAAAKVLYSNLWELYG